MVLGFTRDYYYWVLYFLAFRNHREDSWLRVNWGVPNGTDVVAVFGVLLSERLKETYRNAPNFMDNNLTHALRQMVCVYGWQAVLTELAQFSVEHGQHTNADLLLQASYDGPKLPVVR